MKMQAESHPVYRKPEKTTLNENTNIYYGFSTCDHQISMRFSTRKVVNSDVKTDVAIGSTIHLKNEPSAPKLVLKEVPKSLKNQ